jgi:hypothetical protein
MLQGLIFDSLFLPDRYLSLGISEERKEKNGNQRISKNI